MTRLSVIPLLFAVGFAWPNSRPSTLPDRTCFSNEPWRRFACTQAVTFQKPGLVQIGASEAAHYVWKKRYAELARTQERKNADGKLGQG